MRQDKNEPKKMVTKDRNEKMDGGRNCEPWNAFVARRSGEDGSVAIWLKPDPCRIGGTICLVASRLRAAMDPLE